MFKYLANISDLSHNIIRGYLDNKNIAIDGTLGNGYDTDFLSENFKKVYSFEVQKEPCDNYALKEKENVILINDSHHKFLDYIDENVDCIMYNLGFLPGGSKEITTLHKTSLESIKCGLDILNPGGIMTICIYRGHNEGKIEESCILDFLKNLDKKRYGVMLHSYLNRDINAPILAAIEKK